MADATNEHQLVTEADAAALAKITAAAMELLRSKAPDCADAISRGQAQATLSVGIPTGPALVRIRLAGETAFRDLLRLRMDDAGAHH